MLDVLTVIRLRLDLRKAVSPEKVVDLKRRGRLRRAMGLCLQHYGRKRLEKGHDVQQDETLACINYQNIFRDSQLIR